jgi:hypothetical protein
LACQQKLVHQLATQAFDNAGVAVGEDLSYEQFHQWMAQEPDMLSALEVSFAEHLMVCRTMNELKN